MLNLVKGVSLLSLSFKCWSFKKQMGFMITTENFDIIGKIYGEGGTREP